MLTSKQRAHLRSMANTMDTILYVGKDGISDNTVKEAYDALDLDTRGIDRICLTCQPTRVKYTTV